MVRAGNARDGRGGQSGSAREDALRNKKQSEPPNAPNDGPLFRTDEDGFLSGKNGGVASFNNHKDAARWLVKNKLGGSFDLTVGPNDKIFLRANENYAADRSRHSSFFSNPFLDPGTIDDLLVRPVARFFRRFRETDAGKFAGRVGRLARNGREVPLAQTPEFIKVFDYAASSRVGSLISVRDHYQNLARAGNKSARIISREMDDLIGKIYNEPGAGKYREIPLVYAIEKNRLKFYNDLYDAFGAKKFQEIFTMESNLGRRLSDIMRGIVKPESFEERQITSKLRTILNDIHKYMKKNGVDVGYVENFLPRILSVDKIQKNPSGFIRAATKAYETIGLDSVRAEAAAREMISRELNLADSPGYGNPHASFTRSRKFGAEAEKILNDFYEDDIGALMARYVDIATHLSERVKRFGADDADLKNAINRMEDAGLQGEDLSYFAGIYRNATGLGLGSEMNPLKQAFVLAKVLNEVALLTHMASSQIVETVGMAVKSDGAILGLNAAARSISTIFRNPAKHREDLDGLLCMMGIAANVNAGLAHAGRISDGDAARIRMLRERAFIAFGASHYTNAQRRCVSVSSVSFIAAEARKILSPDAFGKKLSVGSMAELGLRPEDFSRFAKFSDSHEAMAEALHREMRAGTELGNRIHDAVFTMTYQIIQHTGPELRFNWAKGVLGQAVAGLLSYPVAINRNVVLATLNKVKRGFTGDNLTPAERVALIYRAAYAYGIFAAASIGFEQLRQQVLAPQSLAGKTPEDVAATRVVNTAALGNWTIPVGMLYSVSRGGNLSEEILGPYVGNTLGFVQSIADMGINNSEKTNAAEYNAIRSTLSTVVEPLWVAGLVGLAGTNPVGRAMAFGAMSTNLSPFTTQGTADIATAIVGQKSGLKKEQIKYVGSSPVGQLLGVEPKMKPIKIGRERPDRQKRPKRPKRPE